MSFESLVLLAENDLSFICSKRCEMSVLPFNTLDLKTLNNLISSPCSDITVTDTLNHAASSCLNAVEPVPLKHSKKIPFPKSRTVYFDQFLEIKCEYKNPSELAKDFLSNDDDFSIFHNNIRSLSKNFTKIETEILFM